jgi:hypothetical protein
MFVDEKSPLYINININIYIYRNILYHISQWIQPYLLRKYLGHRYHYDLWLFFFVPSQTVFGSIVILIPVVPHKAVAGVSKIGNL